MDNSEPPADLEANFVHSNDPVDYSDSEIPLNFQSNNAPSQHPLLGFRDNLNYSIKFNAIKLLISLAKVIASTVILTKSTSCMDARWIWVILMSVHDFLYCVVTILNMRLVASVNKMLPNRDSSDPQAQSVDANNNQGDYLEESEPHAAGMLNAVREITRKQKLIEKLSTIIETLYFILFIYGQVLYFKKKTSGCESHYIQDLLLAYIVLGYVWLLSPLIFIILACLCLPVVYLFGRGQVSGNRDIMSNLQVKRFSPDLPGSHECAICMVEYNARDKIAQLRCSPLHHFHEGCIKRWLAVNEQCPICRNKVDDGGS